MAAPTLTRALVVRHGAGRSDTYDAALLDVAQDHLLWLLATVVDAMTWQRRTRSPRAVKN